MRVTVDIDPTWTKITCSPIYSVVSALAGVSISFAPLFLYWCGKGRFSPPYHRIVMPLCFAVIYLVPFFYIRLGTAVAKELRKAQDNPSAQ